jgi:hypothetical protein
MRNPSARSWFLSGTAIGAAMLWGLAEVVALQWVWLGKAVQAGSFAARWKPKA